MIEWAVISFLLVAFVICICRRGHRHLLVPWLLWASIVMGSVAGWLVESLPFTKFSGQPTLATALAVAAGMFAGRLSGRATRGWARGVERDIAAGVLPGEPRVTHPLIGAGIAITGSFLAYTVIALRFESLETLNTPRAETGVVLGGEEVRLAGDPALSHAVILVHGFLGSPADFGDLPQRLAARGLTVRAVRLPGHATGPSVLDDVAATEYADRVELTRQELAATHRKVSLVGFSFGGAVALRAATGSGVLSPPPVPDEKGAAAPATSSAPVAPPAFTPHRLVLVNPYFGHVVTPPWCPIDADTLMGIAAATVPRVIKPEGMLRLSDQSQAGRLRAYSTIRTKATVIARGIAREASSPEVAAKVTCPTLLLVSENDRTVPSPLSRAWFDVLPLPAASKHLLRFDRSDHILFLDYDREAAYAAVAAFLTAE
ncbi:MAG: alpha/beta hydrolase [Planctomycetes bacterium]|nr:alpha/beta hydrolase [Planctomycetota bacterium]